MAEEIKGGTPTPEETKTSKVEKVYSKAEVESMIASRVARLKEGKEHEEAMAQAKAKEEALLAEKETLEKQFNELKETTTKKEKLGLIAELGADKDFTDYIYSKVDKGESPEQYAQNIQKFLEEHPKFKSETFTRTNSNAPLSGGGAVKYTNEELEKMSTKEILEVWKKNK